MDTIRTEPPPVTAGPDPAGLRPVAYRIVRRRWPGVLAAAAIGAGVAALAVSSHYDHRSVGQKLDASLGAATQTVQRQTETLKAEARFMGQAGAATTDRVAEQAGGALSDTGITLAVKTALAADPALSAIAIEVRTADGIVTLTGPAPDAVARDRAAVLAAAPQGVRGVDNRLAVGPAAPPKG